MAWIKVIAFDGNRMEHLPCPAPAINKNLIKQNIGQNAKMSLLSITLAVGEGLLDIISVSPRSSEPNL